MLQILLVIFSFIKKHLLQCFKDVKDSISIGFVVRCVICVFVSTSTCYLLCLYNKNLIHIVEVESKPVKNLTEYREGVKLLIYFSDELDNILNTIPEADIISESHKEDKEIDIKCSYVAKNPSWVQKPMTAIQAFMKLYKVAEDVEENGQLNLDSYICRNYEQKMIDELFYLVKWEQVHPTNKEKSFLLLQTYLDEERIILPELYNDNIKFKFLYRQRKKRFARRVWKEESLAKLFLKSLAKSKIVLV